MKKIYSLIVLSFLVFQTQSQTLTQIIRGKVVDKESKSPLFSVNVMIDDSLKPIGTTTDDQGNYVLRDIPIGKQKLKVSIIGYTTQIIPVVLTSGKQLIKDIELEESAVLMKEAQVTASVKGQVGNDMALISAKQFSVAETERYAGSRGDPARMASNFAGVQGSNDSRNDIVVRGNSPLGILWQVEGINIPNPNHFAVSGSQGGPVSIINNKVMGNSDFFTGAFPAEYGNSIAGVFDLKLRNGNNQKHEFSGQFGFLGTELMAEGPLSKKKGSSYLFVYRYSTVRLFDIMGISIGTSAVPKYQDVSFKLNFPIRKGSVSLWAIGGKSDIDILISNQKKPAVDLYGENDRDQYFNTDMGITGITLTKSLNEKTYIKTTFAASVENQKSTHNYILRHINAAGDYQVDSIYRILDYFFTQSKNSFSGFINHKFGAKGTLKAGVNADYYGFNMHDSIFNDVSVRWINRWNYTGGAALIQPYVQYKHKFTDQLVANVGLHAQYFSLNNTSSWIEPRASLKWQISKRQSLSAGYGKHSQIQPGYTYFYHKFKDTNGNDVLHNKNMGFSKSHHAVIGYDLFLTSNWHIKSEIYYQSLYEIPVEIKSSGFSMINQGSGFSRFFPDSLVNKGSGTNYGVELTIEKFFDNSFFFLITGSLYESKYKGSDGIERNTVYNGRYATNFLAGKEFKINAKNTFSIGTKITRAGGQRYGIVDTTASNLAREVIFLDSLRNQLQFKDYFRLDFKVNYVINTGKLTHEIAVDFVNILNTKNILNLTYAPVPGNPSAVPYQLNYQLGFLPIFYYRIDF